MKKPMLWMACGVAVAMLFSCSITRNSAKMSGLDRLPPPSELFATLDSIVNEGWQLYYSERVNWIASDLVLEKFDMDAIGGSVTWKPNDSVWAAVFYDSGAKNCIFEYRYNFVSNQEESMDVPRPISSLEQTEINRKKRMIEQAVDRYADSLYFANQSFGSPNIDIVRINSKLTRLYFLQGTIKPDVIPFGNDYSIDFDEKLEPVAFRKYHRSLIATQTKTEDGGKVETIMHSHLKDNPFITPTDICNFLLYRPEDLTMFFVYSTAYKCKFAYSYSLNQIITVTD